MLWRTKKLRMAVDEEQAEVDPGHRQHHAVERHRAEELAEDDLEIGERGGQQQLDRARPLLFRIGAHRHHRHQEEDQDQHVLQQRANHLLVDVDGLRPLHAELVHLHALLGEVVQDGGEEIAVEQRPQPDHDVGDRRGEVGLQLLLRDCEDVTH
jgi:hypothetical protein